MYTSGSEWFRRWCALPESPAWNALICACALLAVVVQSMDYVSLETVFGLPLSKAGDIFYNFLYLLHVAAHLFNDLHSNFSEKTKIPISRWLLYIADAMSYSHYGSLVFPSVFKTTGYVIKMVCYYVRLHHPFRYLCYLNNYHLRVSVLVSLLKFWYMFVVVRVIYANFHIWAGFMSTHSYESPPSWMRTEKSFAFVRAFYVMDTLFLPIGPDELPDSALARMSALAVIFSGAVLVSGITIASLALIIAVYLYAEEMYRARLRLILKDLIATNVPLPLFEKVQTFYMMYWHRQKGVSVTNLLPTYPPTLFDSIYTDIYFEAMQKSRILCDLSYPFLSEVAKCMETINYIPGDSIISRNDRKFAIVYISYGDVEMLTANDDETPMLRFTRGSIMNPCGGCVEVAASKAHVSIRAATFCTAHVLKAADLWRVALKHGRINGQTYILRASFLKHLERVQKHYQERPHPPGIQKSTILLLKRNLIELKNTTDEDGNLLMMRSDTFLEIAGCYIMRNYKTESLTEEADAICLRTTFPCILQPQSSLLTAWQCFVAVLTLSAVVMHPYHLLYFKTVPSMFIFYNYMLTFLFIVDIIVDLSTGAKIEEGVPTTVTQTSSQQIKSIWFALDVLSTAPIFEFIGTGRFAGINKLGKLPKVFRLLKDLEIVMVYQANMLRFISYVLLMLCLAWLVAALHQGFWCFQFHHCKVTNLTTEPFWSPSELDDGPVEERISFSLYWAVSLTYFVVHKTGQAGKTVWRNSLFVMVLLEGCVVIKIMVEATYSATIIVNTAMRDQYTTCIQTVKHFLLKKNIDPILTRRFITYLRLCWHTDKAYGITHHNKSTMFDLPLHVYKDIAAIKRNKFLICIPFMKLVPQKVLRSISSEARIFSTSPNEILLNTDDMTNEIYVIMRGFCEVVDPDSKKTIRLIRANNCFGDIECLLRIPAYYTIRAVSHVEIISVSRKSLHIPLAMPQLKDAIKYVRSLPQFSRLVNSRRKQFLYFQMPAPAPSREFFPLPRKHVPDSAFRVPFMKLGFLSLLRYVFPRFTIRPDGPYLRRYEWFRVFCAFISANVYPAHTFLSLQFPWLGYITWCLDITAYFDIFQRMLVGYFNEKGILVYHPASTAVHYMKGPFLVDIIACLPLETFDSVQQTIYLEDNAYRCTGVYQILMLNRLLQLYRLPNALDILNDFCGRKDIVLLIKAIPLILSMLNVVTSQMIDYSVTRWRVIGGGWRLEVTEDGEWLNKFSNAVGYDILATPVSLVLTTYFWVTYEVTTTGFNLFQPSSLVITNILAISMLFGTMALMYFAVRVISIRSNVNQALAGFQEHMHDIVTFMKREKFSKQLQREVVSHYEYTWDNMGGTDYGTVLKLCDQITLRTDAILHIYGNTFAKCPILATGDMCLLRILGRAVHSVYLRKRTTIIEHNEVISSIFFVDYGIVEANDYEEPYMNMTMHRGSVFGNLDMKTTVCCPTQFVSKSNLHLLMIETDIFYKIIEDFPSVHELIRMHRPNDEHYIMGIGSLLRLRGSLGSLSKIAPSKQYTIFKYFNTHSKVVQIYLIIVSMLCVYLDLYNVAFQENNLPIISVLYLLDGAFGMKIILNFAVPYTTDEESESQTNVSSRTRYIKREFKIDLLSLLPLEWLSLICLLFNGNLWMWFSVLRLNRVLRVATIKRGLKRYHQKLSINLTMSTIFSVVIWFTLFVHTMSCIWHLLGVYEDSKVPRSSWRYNSKSEEICYTQYFCTVYFILITFMLSAVGDIVPKQSLEVFFVTCFMLCSTLMYMIYVGQFSNIIQYQFFRCFSFYSDHLQLKSFLKNNRVSQNLVDQTNKYSLHLWRVSRGLQVPHFLKTAPQCLRLKIVSTAYMHHLTHHPFFVNCETPFLRHLADKLRPYFYNEDMDVVREHEITNAMYFIHKGRVRELFDDMDNLDREYEEGHYFGTIHGLYQGLPYKSTFKTITKSQVLTLIFDDWKYLLPHYPVSQQFLYPDQNRFSDDYLEKDEFITDDYKPELEISESKAKKRAVLKEPAMLSARHKSELGLAEEGWPISKRETRNMSKHNLNEKEVKGPAPIRQAAATKTIRELGNQLNINPITRSTEKKPKIDENLTTSTNNVPMTGNQQTKFIDQEGKKILETESTPNLPVLTQGNSQWPLDSRRLSDYNYLNEASFFKEIAPTDDASHLKIVSPKEPEKSVENLEGTLDIAIKNELQGKHSTEFPVRSKESLESIIRSPKSDLSFRDFMAVNVLESGKPSMSPVDNNDGDGLKKMAIGNVKVDDESITVKAETDSTEGNDLVQDRKQIEETDDDSTLTIDTDEKYVSFSKNNMKGIWPRKENSKAEDVATPADDENSDEDLKTPTRKKSCYNLDHKLSHMMTADRSETRRSTMSPVDKDDGYGIKQIATGNVKLDEELINVQEKNATMKDNISVPLETVKQVEKQINNSKEIDHESTLAIGIEYKDVSSFKQYEKGIRAIKESEKTENLEIRTNYKDIDKDLLFEKESTTPIAGVSAAKKQPQQTRVTVQPLDKPKSIETLKLGKLTSHTKHVLPEENDQTPKKDDDQTSNQEVFKLTKYLDKDDENVGKDKNADRNWKIDDSTISVFKKLEDSTISVFKKQEGSTISVFKKQEVTSTESAVLPANRGPVETKASMIKLKPSVYRPLFSFREKVTTVEMPKNMISPEKMKSKEGLTSSKAVEIDAYGASSSKKERTNELYLPRLDSLPGFEDYILEVTDKKNIKNKEKDIPIKSKNKRVHIDDSRVEVPGPDNYDEIHEDEKKRSSHQERRTSFSRLFSFGKRKSEESEKKDPTENSDRDYNKDAGPSSSKN